MRKTIAILAIGASLFAGGVSHAEDNIEPDAATNQGFNDGENGFQTISFNVTIPNGTRSTHDDITMKVAGDCEFTTVGKPNTNFTELVVVGHSSSTVHSVKGVPVSTGVHCKVTNSNGGVDKAAALPGNNSVVAGTAEVEYAPFTMCISVSVHYSGDQFDRTREVCRLPISPI